MSDDKLAADIGRGHHAQRLIDDPLLQESITKLRAEYLAAWESSPPRDTDGRERVWQAYQIAGMILTHLQRVAADGALAQAELDQLITKKPNLSIA